MATIVITGCDTGLGVEFGTDGLNAFTDIQVINISKV